MIDGSWYDQMPDKVQVKLAHEQTSTFSHWVTAEGASGFKAESGRYHLYVSYACPWAHRTIMVRRLKGLEKAVSMSVLDPDWGSPNGWVFSDKPNCDLDIINEWVVPQ